MLGKTEGEMRNGQQRTRWLGSITWEAQGRRVLKNFLVLEKTLESPLNCKELKPVNPKGNQSRVFIGRTGVKAPILRPSDVNSQLIGKDPDAGKD